jgi:hypothetical protein
MPVALLLAAVAILAGVVVVAIGRGGELAVFPADSPPRGPDLRTTADIERFRPTFALFGYSVRATDDALQRIAEAVAQRDEQIDQLRGQLAAQRPGFPAAAGAAGSAPVSAAEVPAQASAPRPASTAASAGLSDADRPADPGSEGERW